MKQFQEINDRVYLNLDSKEIYFHEGNILDILNDKVLKTRQEAVSDVNKVTNIVSRNEMYNFLKETNLTFETIDTNNIEFIDRSESFFNRSPMNKDVYSSSVKTVNVLNSEKLAELLIYRNGLKKVKVSVDNKLYRAVTWGEIVSDEHGYLISLSKCLFDIEGIGGTANCQPRHEKLIHSDSPKLQALQKMSEKLINEDKYEQYKRILVSSKEIDFGNAIVRPTKDELYVNIPLHDELFNYYVDKDRHKKENRKKEIDDVIESEATVYSKISSEYAHGSLTKHSPVQLDKEAVEALSMWVTRKIGTVRDIAERKIEEAGTAEANSFFKLQKAEKRLSEIQSLLADAKAEKLIEQPLRGILKDLSNLY